MNEGEKLLLEFASLYVDSDAVISITKSYLEEVYEKLSERKYNQWCIAIQPLLKMDGFYSVVPSKFSQKMIAVIRQWIANPEYQFFAYFSSREIGRVTIRFLNGTYRFWDPLSGEPWPCAADLQPFERKSCAFMDRNKVLNL